MASARWPGGNFVTTRKAASYPPLIARMRRAAINVRVHACVVERAGQDRYSDRAGTAAADVIRVIAPLCGGYSSDDQPDGKKCRSEMHLGLRQQHNHKQTRRFLVTTIEPCTMVRICEEAYPQTTPMPFPEIWKIGPAFPGVPRVERSS